MSTNSRVDLSYDTKKLLKRGLDMSARVLLNLLNELGKRDKMLRSRAFYLFYATSLINLIIQEYEC